MTVADHLTLNELWRRVKKAKDPIEKHRFLAVYHAKGSCQDLCVSVCVRGAYLSRSIPSNTSCTSATPFNLRWILEAKERGAKLIVVDPRFNRTASTADIFAQLRPGTAIAFMGGMIRYILENKRFLKTCTYAPWG